MKSGLRKVEGYQCLDCDAVIDEIEVRFENKFRIDADYYINNDLDENDFRHMLDKVGFFCPVCGYEFE